jgi:Rrf2 family iron-sulfur cluster assembly transcriptional regulator
VLQVLVHSGTLKGIHGPRGDYMLGREHRRISAEEILRAAGSAEEAGEPPLPGSLLVVNNVVRPSLAEGERNFSAALARISVEDVAQWAKALN